MTTTAAPAVETTRTRRNPRYFLISLWSIPVLVIGQFAMLAIIPVLIVLVGSVRDPRVRTVRPWSVVLGASYATPLLIWVVRPDGAQSLSKDIHPAFVVLISLASAVALIRTYTRQR